MVKLQSLKIKFLQLLSYVLLFFLANEFLYPLEEISNTSRIDGFKLLFLLILLSAFLFKNRLLFVISSLFGLNATIFYLYNPNNLLETSYSNLLLFFSKYYNNIYQGLITLLYGESFLNLSDDIKTFLFMLVLILAMSVFIFLINKKKSFYVLILAIIYLGFIEAFYNYDIERAITRAVVLGLFYVSFENQRKIALDLKGKKLFSVRIAITAFLLTSFFVTFGHLFPKASGDWVDSIELFNKSEKQEAQYYEEPIKTIGYGENDAYLGGSLLKDETEIMRTTSNKLSYWRAESKDLYTGKGWINNQKENYIPVSSNIEADQREFPYRLIYKESGLNEKEIIQTLEFPNTRYKHFMFSGDFSKIILNEKADASYGLYNGKLEADQTLKQYTIEATIPIININQLRMLPSNYSEEELEYLKPYLTLPNTLPQRVKELAEDITKDEEGQYDKVYAIQTFLRKNYTYSIENVPFPGQNDDFVDQFLFDSKQGYCNHYSSSMAVMLRSIGIPARWVKGFAPGDVDYNKETGLFEGIVRNSDAHSWIEVYFSGIGWLPFDATPGFRYPLEYGPEAKGLDIQTKDQNPTVESNVIANNQMNSKFDFYIHALDKGIVTKVLLSLTAIIVLARILYKRRLRIRIWFLKLRFRREKSASGLVILVTEHITNVLGKKFEPIEQNQSIREYFIRIVPEYQDNDGLSDSFFNLLHLFEQARYGNKDIKSIESQGEVIDLWKRIYTEIES